MPPPGMTVVAPPDTEQAEVVTVLVTGFGPFLDQYPRNASWLIASSLPALLLPRSEPSSTTPSTAEPTIRILVHPHPLRVSYSHVLSIAPTLPSSVLPRPDIILHLGLAAGRSYFALETGAHRDGYDRNRDVDGHLFPVAQSRALFGDLPPVLRTGLRVEDVHARWRAALVERRGKVRPVDVRVSEDAGNFLCGFIYLNSLATYYRKGWAEAELEAELEAESGRVRRDGNGNSHGKRDGIQVPVLFMHTPDLPMEEDVATGRLVVEELIRAAVASWRAYGAGEANTVRVPAMIGSVPLAPEDANPNSNLHAPVVKN